jgi:hypothetical protein
MSDTPPMRIWARANLVLGLAAAGLGAYVWAVRNICEGGPCNNDWLVPLIVAPLVTLGTLVAWRQTGRRYAALLVAGSAALAVPAAALIWG